MAASTLQVHTSFTCCYATSSTPHAPPPTPTTPQRVQALCKQRIWIWRFLGTIHLEVKYSTHTNEGADLSCCCSSSAPPDPHHAWETAG